MKNIISGAIARISTFVYGRQVKQLFSMIAVGFLILTTNSNLPSASAKALAKEVQQDAHQTDSVRPKTTREWQKEAREVEGDFGDRVKNIGEESAKAVEEFGKLYPNVAKRSARELERNTDM
ncbi:hypothetical protein ACQ4M4_06090 [Leptolyngbya sp. AN02str]|uniref:hypothetical protein n=1 Tax=Leptolyngbya sp. AN02str TaxID=3423363 RepID=UPI003D30FFFA